MNMELLLVISVILNLILMFICAWFGMDRTISERLIQFLQDRLNAKTDAVSTLENYNAILKKRWMDVEDNINNVTSDTQARLNNVHTDINALANKVTEIYEAIQLFPDVVKACAVNDANAHREISSKLDDIRNEQLAEYNNRLPVMYEPNVKRKEDENDELGSTDSGADIRNTALVG